jgi:hypothetical protein
MRSGSNPLRCPAESFDDLVHGFADVGNQTI